MPVTRPLLVVNISASDATQSYVAPRDCAIVAAGADSSVFVVSTDPEVTVSSLTTGSVVNDELLLWVVPANPLSGIRVPISAGDKIYISAPGNGEVVLYLESDT